ncbi:MAG: SGNH/GDSL hydrolase family protein [Actinomycetales bacterium]
MSRASRARRAARTAAKGGGAVGAGLVGLSAIGYGVLFTEAKIARRTVGTPFEQAPRADGVYDDHGLVEGAAADPAIDLQLAMLGDSSAAGLGVDLPEETPGAIVASGLAGASNRRVHLVNVAVSGAVSSDLDRQLEQLLEQQPRPDVALIMIGANDVTHRVRPAEAVRHLARTVTVLRELGCGVVVGTCPDLGTIEPIPPPLRTLARKWSRDLAAAQVVGVVEAGGRTVSLGDLLGAEFAAAPRDMFSADRFHPSAHGYARAAATMLPSVCAEVGLWPDGGFERMPDYRRGEAVEPVSRAAVRAVRDPGVEVSASELGGRPGGRGRRGVWAVLLRRRQEPMPEQDHHATSSAEDSTVPAS